MSVILDQRRVGGGGGAAVEQGIYFATVEQPEQSLIEFFSFATGKVRLITTPEKNIPGGSRCLAVSPDGRWLIWTQTDQGGTDIMLMENFR